MLSHFRQKQHWHTRPESLHLSRQGISGIASQLQVADDEIDVVLQEYFKRPTRTPSSQYTVSVLFQHKTAEIKAGLFVIDTQNRRSRWSSQHSGSRGTEIYT
jgi:hypothetical protein